MQTAINTKGRAISKLYWAFDHRHSRSPKYQSSAHPIFAIVFGTAFFILGVLLLQQLTLHFIPEARIPATLPPSSDWIAMLLLVYLCIMISTRYTENGPLALYQFLWACNLCILLVCYAIYKRNRYLIGAALVTISTDQVLWYVDALGYLTMRKFPVGVAKYMVWPETTWLRRATSSHHIWFIPLMLYILKDCSPIDFKCYTKSLWIVVLLGLIGRWLAPREIILQSGRHVYMNVNLSWQLWKDVKVDWVKKLHHAPFYVAFVGQIFLWGSASFLFLFVLRWAQGLFK